jgi:hypothetical protein
MFRSRITNRPFLMPSLSVARPALGQQLPQGARRQSGVHRRAVGLRHLLVGQRERGIGADRILDGGRGLGAIEARGLGSGRQPSKTSR